MTKFYSTLEISKLLRISQTRVARLISQGKLAAVDICDGPNRLIYRVSQEALDDFLASRAVGNKAKKPMPLGAVTHFYQ